MGFSINSGIVGFGCKFLGVKYIFDGAKEIEISTDICFDFDKGKLYIGGARTETTFIEGGIGLAGVYGYSETKQKETSCEIEAGYDFNNETIFGDIITNEQEQHNTTEFTLGIYNNKKNENTNKSEISISTDVHIDVLLVGTKIEGGLFFEE